MRILARLVGPIACLGLPTAALGQTDTSETNPQVLEGLQAVNPSVTVVSSAPDQFSEENMQFLQHYLTFQFAVSLENLGLDIEEDAPRIECSVSLSEARDFSDLVIEHLHPELSRVNEVSTKSGQPQGAVGWRSQLRKHELRVHLEQPIGAVADMLSALSLKLVQKPS